MSASSTCCRGLPQHVECSKGTQSAAPCSHSSPAQHQLASLTSDQQLDNMLEYLSTYGQQISSISISNKGEVRWLSMLPPCPRLERLSLAGLDVMLAPDARTPGVLQAPALTQLCLQDSGLGDWHDLSNAAAGTAEAAGGGGAAVPLPGLTNLQKLSVTWTGQVRESMVDQHTAEGPQPYWLVRPKTLSYLVRLTHLHVQGPDPRSMLRTAPGLQHLHHLKQLQQVKLDVEDWVWIQHDTFSGLQQLTLLELGTEGGFTIVLDPAALAALPQLRHLVLCNAELDSPSAAAAAADVNLTEFFLAHLGKLQQLTRLQLVNCDLNGHRVPREHFTSLTASGSNLRHLEVRNATCLRGTGSRG